MMAALFSLVGLAVALGVAFGAGFLYGSQVAMRRWAKTHNCVRVTLDMARAHPLAFHKAMHEDCACDAHTPN